MLSSFSFSSSSFSSCSTIPFFYLSLLLLLSDDGAVLLWSGTVRSMVLLWWVQSYWHWGSLSDCATDPHHQQCQGHQSMELHCTCTLWFYNTHAMYTCVLVVHVHVQCKYFTYKGFHIFIKNEILSCIPVYMYFSNSVFLPSLLSSVKPFQKNPSYYRRIGKLCVAKVMRFVLRKALCDFNYAITLCILCICHAPLCNSVKTRIVA